MTTTTILQQRVVDKGDNNTKSIKETLTNQLKLSSISANTRSDGKDFSWSYTDEPHATRRKVILAKYPQIKELFVPEPLTAVIVVGLVAIQILMAFLLRESHWYYLVFFGWLVGGTINHSLQLAVHELSHNLAFNSPIVLNKIVAIMGNLPTMFPSAVVFQKYHMDHHQFQGVNGIDTDIPSTFEVNYFTNSLMKVLWIMCQPLFYALRPVFIKPKPIGKWEVINLIICLSFDFMIYYYLGIKSCCYLVSGTILGLGLHPAAGHFIAEHYEFVKGIETYSYYGFCNYLNFNVGYHNEHHDFPRIPWSKLPLVKKIAPEFYDNLPSYNSYCAVFWKYITDDEVGPFARIKRSPPINNSKSIDQNASKMDNNTSGTSLTQIFASGFFLASIGAVAYTVIA